MHSMVEEAWMEPIIEVKELCKKYKSMDGYAVRNMSFSVQPGEIVGVLGPNGAGKSTLIKMLLGVIRPTSGALSVMGKAPISFRNADKAKLGVYLGGKSNLIYHLPVLDSVRLFQSIYKVPKETFARNLARYAALLQCDGYLHQRVATLSLGQRLRAELLCILIYEPSLLILDEPTLGLDIEGKRQIRDMFHQLVTDKRLSVVITTHDVHDIQRLCSRILMVCQGEKVMDVTSERFDEILRRHTVLLTDAALNPLPEGVQYVEQENGCCRYLVPAALVEQVKAAVQRLPYRQLRQEAPLVGGILYAYYR